MQFGINLLCLTDVLSDEHDAALETIIGLGYDGVEVPVLSGDPEGYARLAKKLDGIGLRRCCTAIIPDADANPLSADPAVRKRGLAHLDWISDCAEALGAESIGGPFHAPLGVFTGQGPSESEIAHGAEAHHAMAERAARNGMVLSLEVLNRFETHFLNTAQQAKAYVARVDHPAFGIMYDSFHANIEERDQVAAITELGRAINVFHVSENDRGIPGRGQIDFPALFRAIRATGFDGWVTVEAFSAGLPGIAAATRVWRPLFPDHETLFSEAIANMRRWWDEAA
ncbi:sugar phosphate isomerase/epimerase family protein [Frigidibacter sp. ROC022]|uniref:sugar phosphate isomerase/epimerase family protein n=1 Tax=Frigidibacter sp. ROC022 TaxID=2971796 RepID=UPI00215AD8D5|nr:sugar phosphate isomerase/epimerase family protein [Frigidibacter sp. ROC022]MCR8725392.1 sugar phosphate isomerase/epimerase [Frigidibacter sp. ROC022]